MTKRKHPKTRAAELEHHITYDESIESQLCKLHIHVITYGHFPKAYFKIWEKSNHGKDTHKLKTDEVKKLDLLMEYSHNFRVPEDRKSGKPLTWLNLWKNRILLRFCEFIDDPVRCHRGNLQKLHYCKSSMRSLQFKQRVTLVQLVTTLFVRMDVETLIVGKYGEDKVNHSDKVYNENGQELMQGMTHPRFMTLYERIWNKPISKTKYFDTLNMLKLAGFFNVEACYLGNDEAEVKRAELRENGASIEEIEAVPSIHSKAAYKWFSDEFIALFGIRHKRFMRQFNEETIAERVKKGLANYFATYNSDSSSFWTKKRLDYLNRQGRPRYPQGQMPRIDETLPELIPIRH